jgi:uncharacterized protein
MTPGFKLIANGRDITSDVMERHGVVEWTDTVDEGSDGLTITLADTDNLVAVPKAGVKVELSAGYDGALQKAGTFFVSETEIEGPPDRVIIQATSAPVTAASGQSIAARNSKSWEETTLGAIAQSIAGKLGVQASIDSQLAVIQVTNEQQVDQSDTDFLLRLVRRAGGFLKFTQGRMVIAREGAGTSTGGQALTVQLTRSDLSRWSVRAGGKRAAIEKVKMKVHDYETGETTEVEAEVPKPGSVGEFGVSQAGSGNYTPVSFTGPNPFAKVEDAQTAAKTTAARIARASRGFEIELPGRLDIVAGGKINLSGVRDGVNGSWLVKSVRHRIDSGGWSMSVSGEGT